MRASSKFCSHGLKWNLFICRSPQKSTCACLKYFFGLSRPVLTGQLESDRKWVIEREVTCNKGPQVEFELWAAAVRTASVHQLSYWGGPLAVFVNGLLRSNCMWYWDYISPRYYSPTCHFRFVAAVALTSFFQTFREDLHKNVSLSIKICPVCIKGTMGFKNLSWKQSKIDLNLNLRWCTALFWTVTCADRRGQTAAGFRVFVLVAGVCLLVAAYVASITLGDCASYLHHLHNKPWLSIWVPSSPVPPWRQSDSSSFITGISMLVTLG